MVVITLLSPHLSHLDLQLVCIHQELRGHTKAATGNLLDLAGGGVAILQATQVGEGAALAL